jgi:hypothetical protein
MKLPSTVATDRVSLKRPKRWRMLAMLQGANRLEHRLRRLAAQKCGMTSRNIDMDDLDCRWPAPYYDEAGNRIVMADTAESRHQETGKLRRFLCVEWRYTEIRHPRCRTTRCRAETSAHSRGVKHGGEAVADTARLSRLFSSEIGSCSRRDDYFDWGEIGAAASQCVGAIPRRPREIEASKPKRSKLSQLEIT